MSEHGLGDVDWMLCRLAQRQHGVVARRQLVALGVSSRTVEYRMERARLHPVHQGVYAVGHPGLTVHGRWMAAVLAHGPTAVLSHRSAGSLWGLLRSSRAVIEVTAERRWPRPGVQLHRSALPEDEVTTLDGIPVTTVPRTLFDLAAVVEARKVERAIEEAEVRALVDPLSLQDLLGRHPRRHGAATLRAALASVGGYPTPTRSELEDRFIALLDANGLPRPSINARLEVEGQWIECDCVWRSHKLIVELDGRATHRTAAAFERDRARDRLLQVAGWRVVRITWRQLHDEGQRVATDLRELLS